MEEPLTPNAVMAIQEKLEAALAIADEHHASLATALIAEALEALRQMPFP